MTPKTSKTLLCAALAAVMTLTLFFAPACTPKAAAVKITVGFLRGTSAEEKQFYDECIEGFEKAYPQYEIVSSPYVYDAETAVAKFASGQLPTVFEADAQALSGALEAGYVRDVAGGMKAFGWYDKADDGFLARITHGGKVCGVPAEQYLTGMALNLPLLAEAGVIEKDGAGKYRLYDKDGKALYPDTFEKIEAAAKRVSAVSRGGNAVFFPTGDADCGKIYTDIIYNFGCENMEYREEGKWKLSLSGEAVGDAVRWVKFLAQEGYTDDTAMYGINDWAKAFSGDDAAFAFLPSNRLTAALAAEPALNGNIAFVPMPTADGRAAAAVWNGTVYAVSGSASDEQARGAFEFLRYMGLGADSDEESLHIADRRLKKICDSGVSVLPTVSGWKDEEYKKKMQEIYAKYENTPYEYFSAFYEGFDKTKRDGEPHERTKLHSLIDGIFAKMLYEATTVNIVTFISEQESAFNEKYSK